MGHRIFTTRAFPIGLLLCITLAAHGDPTLLMTADTEGHILPCATCPEHVGLGGLVRRATVIAKARADQPLMLLIDTGNWLVGPESASTRGDVMVTAYNQLGYDVVHLTPKDLFWGKADTLAVLQHAKFSTISANVLDDQTGKPLVEPFVVKKVGEQTIAFLGVSEPPLPQLRDRFVGLQFDDPVKAIEQWLPKAKAASGRVVILYSGNGKSLRKLRTKLADSDVVIFAAGVRPEDLAPDGGLTVVAAEEHGKSVASAVLNGKSGAQISQLMVTPDLAADDNLRGVLASVLHPAPAIAPAATLPVAAIPPLVVKGLAGVGLTDTQVQAAIDHGSEFLWKYLQTAVIPTEKLGSEPDHILACYALVHTGASKRFPEFDKAVRELLTNINPRASTERTYQQAVLCMLIEAYGDPAFYPKLRIAARRLMEEQGPRGSWDYGWQVPEAAFAAEDELLPLHVLGGVPLDGTKAQPTPWKRLVDWDHGKDGDNSTTQFALLGLAAAARSQINLPPELFQRSLQSFLNRQCEDGSWAYEKPSRTGYASMTSAAICSLAIARHASPGNDEAVDRATARGMAWLDAHFSVTDNPGSNQFHFYNLYSMERVGSVLETSFIGSHEWYPLGARYLVDAQQADGRWVESNKDENPVGATSFALLFLTRATPKLDLVMKHGGNGVVKTTVAAPPHRMYVILDASGSMLDEMEGRVKFDVAREAVAQVVEAMPENSEMALRVYGHRKRATEPGADDDTELLIPMGKLDKKKFASTLQHLRARGKTPLAKSLDDARADLGSALANPDAGPLALLLLTDGGEDTQAHRNPITAAGELRKFKGLKFHVVGFDINREEWSQQLEAMVTAGGGKYWPAAKARDVLHEIRAAALGQPDQFFLFDSNDRQVATASFGESSTLPEGKYRLKTRFAGQPLEASMWVNTGQTTAVVFDSNRMGNAPKELLAPATQPVTGAFCTHCGARLSPGAKFCVQCGRKVQP